MELSWFIEASDAAMELQVRLELTPHGVWVHAPNAKSQCVSWDAIEFAPENPLLSVISVMAMRSPTDKQQ